VVCGENQEVPRALFIPGGGARPAAAAGPAHAQAPGRHMCRLTTPAATPGKEGPPFFPGAHSTFAAAALHVAAGTVKKCEQGEKGNVPRRPWGNATMDGYRSGLLTSARAAPAPECVTSDRTRACTPSPPRTASAYERALEASPDPRPRRRPPSLPTRIPRASPITCDPPAAPQKRKRNKCARRLALHTDDSIARRPGARVPPHPVITKCSRARPAK
jgi:hypothetical protein